MTKSIKNTTSELGSMLLFVCGSNSNLGILVKHSLVRSRAIFGVSHRELRFNINQNGLNDCFYFVDNPQIAGDQIVKELIEDGLLLTIENDPRDQQPEIYLEMLGTGFLENPLVGFGTEKCVTIIYPEDLQKANLPGSTLNSHKQDYQETELEKKLRYLRAFTWAMTAQITQEKAKIIWESGSNDEKSMLKELDCFQKEVQDQAIQNSK